MLVFRVEVTSRLGQDPGRRTEDAAVRAQALHAVHPGLRLGPGPARPHRGRLLREEPRPGGGHPDTVSISRTSQHCQCTAFTPTRTSSNDIKAKFHLYISVYQYSRMNERADLFPPSEVEERSEQEWMTALHTGYQQSALNCWIAALLYLVTLVVSAHQLWSNHQNQEQFKVLSSPFSVLCSQLQLGVDLL